MFWYVSFLRPPPTHASLSSPLSFTPQIANDLRTDLCDVEHDIFYSWNTPHSQPLKLTTWRQSNAYKELSVPPPSGVRDGQSYRLILTTTPITPYINLAGSELGALPFPVFSVPILFTKNASKSKNKQERIERVYRFTLPITKTLASIKITEQTSFDLDKKIWDSGIGLSSWIVKLLEATNDDEDTLVNRLRESLLSTNPRNIIELGAGTGIVAITIGALRADLLSGYSMKPTPTVIEGETVTEGAIYTTDLPSAIPLLEHNISINTHLFNSPTALETQNHPTRIQPHTPIPSVLDWDSPLPEFASSLPGRGNLDLIVMADVTYNTSSFPSLVRTIKDLVQIGSDPSSSNDNGDNIQKDENENQHRSNSPLILIGYKQRDLAERELFHMLQQEFTDERRGVKLRLSKVGEVRGASNLDPSCEEQGEGWGPVEVWIGEVVKKNVSV
ncbi:hypothetical protein K435DRAFT_756958 [Dendrothele bispora CBS 962.96]|uniref:Methyltransferase n=1 Tax=Dendrothele bispora (strain CBS 962.96) TaxID=1314807 RepID=A0A4S8LXH3_DENBC|nr:hypothetical protein K435DRAFT_756958 [Dendrothele bispora CBS 962.96]